MSSSSHCFLPIGTIIHTDSFRRDKRKESSFINFTRRSISVRFASRPTGEDSFDAKRGRPSAARKGANTTASCIQSAKY